ncbi:hypothetical protein WME77_06785 [Sorangium sp. So ce764]|uniref:hypothetical protein n=1 Tax=Sorangium sp. So ce764 TaxID=3133320 RepID=UPI003F6315E9
MSRSVFGLNVLFSVGVAGCKEGQPVVYCTHPGGHSVPSGAGGRAWRFFQSLK